MTTLTLAPPRYRLRRVIGYLPETRAQTILRRLNIILGRDNHLDADHPFITARDELAFALSTGDGVEQAATCAASALIAAWKGGAL